MGCKEWVPVYSVHDWAQEREAEVRKRAINVVMRSSIDTRDEVGSALRVRNKKLNEEMLHCPETQRIENMRQVADNGMFVLKNKVRESRLKILKQLIRHCHGAGRNLVCCNPWGSQRNWTQLSDWMSRTWECMTGYYLISAYICLYIYIYKQKISSERMSALWGTLFMFLYFVFIVKLLFCLKKDFKCDKLKYLNILSSSIIYIFQIKRCFHGK